MDEAPQIEYPSLVELVEYFNLDITGAELHGLVTASVCIAAKNNENNDWIKLVVPYESLDNEQLAHLTNALKIIYQSTLQSLEDDSFGFNPLLPDEESDIDFRAMEMATWCRGFMLAYQQIEIAPEILSDDALEAYQDLAEIAQLETGEGEEEDLAQALTELEEYLRVAVLLIFEDLNPAQTVH